MNILIVSCSLNPDSVSRALAGAADQFLSGLDNVSVALHDLREHPVPPCDGSTTYGHEHAAAASKAAAAADAILFASPVYNYDVNAAAKAFIEHAGRACSDKVIGFLLAAGGQGSYMAVMPFANSMMLDFRCYVVPRFVYATGNAVRNGKVADNEVLARIEALCTESVRVAGALKQSKETDAAQ